MDDTPFEIPEPMHPKAHKEAQKRVSLAEAIEKEIKYLEGLEERQSNPMWASVVKHTRYSWMRVYKEWVDGK